MNEHGKFRDKLPELLMSSMNHVSSFPYARMQLRATARMQLRERLCELQEKPE